MRAAVIGSANLEHGGGGERSALQTAKILAEIGYEVSIFGSGSDFNRTIKIDDDLDKRIKYVRSAFSSDVFSTNFLMKFSMGFSLGLIGMHTGKRFWNELGDFDVYYFTFPGMLFRSIASRLISSQKRATIILANHGTYYEILNSRNSFFFSAISHFLDSYILKPFSKSEISIQAQNQYQVDHFLKLGFDRSKIKIIPQCNIPTLPSAFVNRNDSFKVAFLGRLTRNKGVHLLEEIIKSLPTVGFEVIGDGPLKNNLKETFKGRNNVRVHGYVDESEKNVLLSECDIMVNCSRFESLSVSTIEGMLEGLVTVASNTSSGHRYLNTLVPNSVVLTDHVPSSYVRAIEEMIKLKNETGDEYLRVRNEISKSSSLIFNQDRIISLIKGLFMSQNVQKAHKKEAFSGEIDCSV